MPSCKAAGSLASIAPLPRCRKPQTPPFTSASRSCRIPVRNHAVAGCCDHEAQGCHGHEPDKPAKLPPQQLQSRRAVLLASYAAVTASTCSSAQAKPNPGSQGGDWSSPGLAAAEDDAAPKFYKTPSGVKIQELRVGSGPVAKAGDRVEIEYVLRRSNGYFIYSTVEGVSFQPRDIPTGPIDLTLGDGRNIAGLEEVIEGMQPAGKRRALIPAELGYVAEGLLPQPPGFAAKRQVLNHASEGLTFEVQLVRIRP